MTAPRPLRPLVDQVSRARDQRLPEQVASALAQWLELMRTWNRRIDLTAARDDQQLVELGIIDALVLASVLQPSATVVDVGSGAGAPGLALAILRPDLRVTLVEPQSKRVAFLRTVSGSVPVAATVVRERVEALVARAERFDVAVSRATLGPEQWLAVGLQLVGSQVGRVAVLLASQPAPERDDAVLEVTVDYAGSATAGRRLCVYKKR